MITLSRSAAYPALLWLVALTPAPARAQRRPAPAANAPAPAPAPREVAAAAGTGDTLAGVQSAVEGSDAQFRMAASVDIDGDGSAEVLLEGDGMSTPTRASIARRSNGVWRIYQVRSGGMDEVQTSQWQPMIVSGTTRFAVLNTVVQYERSRPYTEFAVYAFGSGRLYQVFLEDSNNGRGAMRFDAATGGGLLVVQSAGRPPRRRLIQWDESAARLTIGPAADSIQVAPAVPVAATVASTGSTATIASAQGTSATAEQPTTAAPSPVAQPVRDPQPTTTTQAAVVVAAQPSAAPPSVAPPPASAPALPPQPAPNGLVPLQLFWSDARGDNYTTGTQAGAQGARNAGYRFVRTEGYAYATQAPGTVPLLLMWDGRREDNFVTATAVGAQSGTSAGYQNVRVEAYVFPTSRPGTVPLRLYWSTARGDNFTTSSPDGDRDARAAGYMFVRVEGYVFQSPSGAP